MALPEILSVEKAKEVTVDKAAKKLTKFLAKQNEEASAVKLNDDVIYQINLVKESLNNNAKE